MPANHFDISSWVPSIVDQIFSVVAGAVTVLSIGAAVSYGCLLFRRIDHWLNDPGIDNFAVSLDDAEAWANDLEFATDAHRAAQLQRNDDYVSEMTLEAAYYAGIADLGSVADDWEIEDVQPGSGYD